MLGAIAVPARHSSVSQQLQPTPLAWCTSPRVHEPAAVAKGLTLFFSTAFRMKARVRAFFRCSAPFARSSPGAIPIGSRDGRRRSDRVASRPVRCLLALDLSAASASSRGEAACGHTPCCGNYFHKRCLSQWLQGSRQSGSPLPIEKKCPTCRRDLVARALIPRALPTAPLHECK